MEEFVIDRSKWLRGEGSEDSVLLREEDGKMCCLGQYCLFKGLAPSSLQGNRTAENIVNHRRRGYKLVPAWLVALHLNPTLPDKMKASELALKLMRTNDDAVIKDADREATLTILFAEAGIHVTFIDGEAA
jgi:hypothetical protein